MEKINFQKKATNDFGNIFFEPNCIAAMKLPLRRTAYTFGNPYHQARSSSKFISQLLTPNPKL